MKKAYLSLLVASLISSTASYAWSNNTNSKHSSFFQNSYQDDHRSHSNHKKINHKSWNNLSEDEKRLIKNLMKETKKLYYQNKAKMIDMKDELKSIIAADQFNKNKFLELTEKKSRLQFKSKQLLADTLEQLSPEARKLLMKKMHKSRSFKKRHM